MRELLTPDRFANQIRLLRDNPLRSTTAFLLLEGTTDEKVYQYFVNKNTCQITVTHNKNMAIQVLTILEKDSFAGILAIVDADFDVLEGNLPSSPNILFTDTHDLETMLLKSLALEKLLDNYGSDEKIAKFEEKAGKDIRIILIEAATHLGYLRWVSLKHDLSLTFEGLDFEKFVDREALTIGLSKLIKNVKDKSQKQGIAEGDLRKKMELLRNKAHDPWHICCGHDLISILSLGLCRTIGTHNTKEAEPDIIEMLLRLAYERSFFTKTQLYASIRQWERNNPPFIVLSAE